MHNAFLDRRFRKEKVPPLKLHYYPETDSPYIDLNERPGAESVEVADGVIADFDSEGNIVGIDIEHASEKLDLSKLEAEELPRPI
jgi:uncharacterized protein YuzE